MAKLTLSLVLLPLGAAAFAAGPRSHEPARFERVEPSMAAAPRSFPERSPVFATEKEAAAAFVDAVRADFPEQRIEYCAFILRRAGGYVYETPPTKGDPDRCPSPARAPAQATASVHTHPIFDPPTAAELSGSAQLFSENDFAYAEARGLPIYLGAPAGHILYYRPGATTCRGDMVRHAYELARPARGGKGELAIRPDEFVYVAGARAQAYCRSRSR